MLPGHSGIPPALARGIAQQQLAAGVQCERQGDFDGALQAYEKALAAVPSMADALARLTGILEMAATERYHAGLAGRIRQALATPGVNTEALYGPAALQLRHKYTGGKPEQNLAAALNDDLLRLFLRRTINRDLQLEPALIALRDGVSARLKAGDADAATRRLGVSLALQAFNNEYIWPSLPNPPDINDFGPASRASLENMACAIIRSALGRALTDLPDAEAWAELSLSDWPEPMRELVERTLRSPTQESAIAESLESITSIGAGTSANVREMYEENPFPRWIALPHLSRVDILKAASERFPHMQPPAKLGGGPVQILMPGAGTGQHPLSVAASYQNVEVTAVDLSRRSLAYGKRMAMANSIKNIKFLHGDLLKLDTFDQRFHLIECVGVLHHLAEPDAGFLALAGCLLPGGLMRIGLYGEHARRDVVAGRKMIARNGIPETLSGLRTFRDTVMRTDDAALTPLMERDDFYSSSLLRDLVFHRQEMRYTIPRLRQSLNAADLTFLGFEFAAGFSRRQQSSQPAFDAYRQAWPNDKPMADLARWEDLEAKDPGLFPGYSFWCQRSA